MVAMTQGRQLQEGGLGLCKATRNKILNILEKDWETTYWGVPQGVSY